MVCFSPLSHAGKTGSVVVTRILLTCTQSVHTASRRLLWLLVWLCTKEIAIWAPVAAAIPIILHPKLNESFHRQVFTAALMFLPIMMWFGLRFAFFGGIGGTYATLGYSPLVDFLKLSFDKL